MELDLTSAQLSKYIPSSRFRKFWTVNMSNSDLFPVSGMPCPVGERKEEQDIPSVDIDTKLKRENHEMYNTLVDQLDISSIEESLQECTGVMKVAVIIVLKVLFPSLSEDLQLLTSSPLGPFQSPDDALVYIEDMIESGAFSETRQMIYIIGRNEIGKTSLLTTLKKFAENPTQTSQFQFSVKIILSFRKQRLLKSTKK